jgi:hypothetical protein
MMQDGRRYRLKETGEIGRLEGPPLMDPGEPPVSEDTGILWIPDFGEADYWVYVTANELEDLEDE